MNRNKKIIIIDDDKNMNRLISYNLTQNGFTPQSVYDGISAKERLENEHFDIVILDVMLPGLDGFEICKIVKTSPQGHKTFVIMVTARAASSDKLYANLLGVDSYFTKPFSLERLMSLIKEFSDVQDREFLVSPNNVRKTYS